MIQAAADEAELATHGPPLHEDVLVQLFRQCTELEVDYPEVWDTWSFARIKWVAMHRHHRERDRIWRESVATRVATIEDEDGAAWKGWAKAHLDEE